MYGRRYKKTRKFSKIGSSSSRVRYNRRRRFNRRRFRSTGTSISRFRPRWENPLPNTKLCKFVYNDEAFSSTVSGIDFIVTRIWSHNSLYDPDYTGVGVQPYGYDQMFSSVGPFTVYKVIASKISLYFHSMTQDVKTPVKVTLIPWMGTAFPAHLDATDLMRQPFARSNLIDFTQDNSNSRKLTAYCKTSSLAYGHKTDGTYASDYLTNPANRTFWYVHFSTATTQLPATINYDVKITYYTQCEHNHADVNES